MLGRAGAIAFPVKEACVVDLIAGAMERAAGIGETGQQRHPPIEQRRLSSNFGAPVGLDRRRMLELERMRRRVEANFNSVDRNDRIARDIEGQASDHVQRHGDRAMIRRLRPVPADAWISLDLLAGRKRRSIWLPAANDVGHRIAVSFCQSGETRM